MFRLMPELRHTRIRSSGVATRDALMAAGEWLMGEEGLEAPPLHVIASTAGSANKYAVQYHFGDRRQLIAAILEARAEAITTRRAELIVEASVRGHLTDVAALVEAMFLPLIEQHGDHEPLSFLRFLLLALTQPWQNRLLEILGDVADDPSTRQLRLLLQQALPHLTQETIGWRLRLYIRFILFSFVEKDNLQRLEKESWDRSGIVGDTFAMVVAGLKT